jgi:hypothetical protein
MNETYQPGTLAPLIPTAPRKRKPKMAIWIGLGIIVLLLCCVAGVVVAFFERNQIPAFAQFFSTSTPAPTNTPLATHTPVPTHTPIYTATNTPIPPTSTPKSFFLTGTAFEASLQDTCNTDVQITAVEGTSFSVTGTISFRNGGLVVWCYNARHTWLGTLTYAGYTFASDPKDPLQFMVDQTRGYVYVGGKGTVTSPDGKVVSLP